MMTPRFRFTPEMFDMRYSVDDGMAADRANAALNEYLKTCPRVTGFLEGQHWLLGNDPGATSEDTHEALLFDLREIEKAECEHEPASYLGEPIYSNPVCSKCGAKLKATWSEVKP